MLTVAGAGNTNTKHSYQAFDHDPFTGQSYYRLKQTDFDGKETYFKPVMIKYTGLSHAVLSVYPIPAQAQELVIQMKGLQPDEDFPFEVMDMKGKKIYTTTLTADQSGNFSNHILPENAMPAGIYLVKTGYALSLIKKVVIK